VERIYLLKYTRADIHVKRPQRAARRSSTWTTSQRPGRTPTRA